MGYESWLPVRGCDDRVGVMIGWVDSKKQDKVQNKVQNKTTTNKAKNKAKNLPVSPSATNSAYLAICLVHSTASSSLYRFAARNAKLSC